MGKMSNFLQHFNPPTRKGWDRRPPGGGHHHQDFNPPTRKGWDKLEAESPVAVLISIHPPARGGTVTLPRMRHRKCYFNPPTRKGWDPGGQMAAAGHRNFNPPTRKGWDDNLIRSDYAYSKISIHPPARGGTPSTLRMRTPKPFQSTHPQGVGQQKFTKQTSHSIQNQQK